MCECAPRLPQEISETRIVTATKRSGKTCNLLENKFSVYNLQNMYVQNLSQDGNMNMVFDTLYIQYSTYILLTIATGCIIKR